MSTGQRISMMIFCILLLVALLTCVYLGFVLWPYRLQVASGIAAVALVAFAIWVRGRLIEQDNRATRLHYQSEIPVDGSVLPPGWTVNTPPQQGYQYTQQQYRHD